MRALLPSLLLLLAACGGSDADLDRAARQLRLGNLDRAAAQLEGLEGDLADQLRGKVAQAVAHRAAYDAQLGALYAEFEGQSMQELIAAVKHWGQREKDPLLADRLAQLASSLYDQRAEKVARGYAKEDWSYDQVNVEFLEEGESPRRGTGDGVLNGILLDVQRAREGRSWAEALSLLEMVLDDAPAYAGKLHPLVASVTKEADMAGKDLLNKVVVLEQQGKHYDARRLIAREVWRYPNRSQCVAIHERVEQDRIARAGNGPDRGAAGRSTEPVAHAGDLASRAPAPALPYGPRANLGDLAAIDLAIAATMAESQDDFGYAHELWVAAADGAAVDRERARYELRGLQAEARLVMRTELAAAFAADPTPFAATGVETLEVGGLTMSGTPVAWSDLTASNLARIAGVVDLDDQAQVGLALEKLEREDAHGSRGGLADLSRLHERGAVATRTVWHLIAEYRREPVPDGGYEWRDGAWISSLDLERAALARELEALGSKLVRANSEDRDELFAQLVDHARASEVGRQALDAALRERFARSVSAVVKGKTIDQLSTLAKLRADLDERRQFALDLIYDTETYFYPYNPPAASTGKTVGDYYEAQREVDVRVGRVREAWEVEYGVSLPKGFREALADADWIRDQFVHVRGPLLLPEDWPDWLEGVDTSLDRVTVQDFATTNKERLGYARNRLVRAFNEHRWESSDALGTLEQQQVRITNDYRVMLGRPAVAWNEKIQQAADWHSNYMANTGNFGHNEPEDPDNRTPFDRMRRVGYSRGVSENCHRGSGDPAGAHNGWTHSSGHHRNLLMATHREMASAAVSGYWTQNFGTGTEFESELEAWRD